MYPRIHTCVTSAIYRSEYLNNSKLNAAMPQLPSSTQLLFSSPPTPTPPLSPSNPTGHHLHPPRPRLLPKPALSMSFFRLSRYGAVPHTIDMQITSWKCDTYLGRSGQPPGRADSPGDTDKGRRTWQGTGAGCYLACK